MQNICAASDKQLFVLASNSLYQYNQNDESITTYDKVNGLSDTYITHIAWNPKAQKLIVIYQNSNIDLIDTKGNIINISALYTKIMTESKEVNSLKVNMQKAEITDTYTPNNPDYPKNLPSYNEYKDLEAYRAVVGKLSPIGPKYNHFYESTFLNGKLYTTGGYFLSGMNDYNYPGTIQEWIGRFMRISSQRRQVIHISTSIASVWILRMRHMSMLVADVDCMNSKTDDC